MKYVGIYSQQANNNAKSLMLLALFPCILLGVVYAIIVTIFCLSADQYSTDYYYDDYGNLVSYASATTQTLPWDEVNLIALQLMPWLVGGVLIWFLIAYYGNTAMIRQATGARSLNRSENPRVYNIVENLTMTCGMPMPKVNVIDSPQLNAFASGIDDKSYTVTVTTGLLQRLDDAELAGVIGHELTHIRNRDTRLLIISIIFVGIMSTAMNLVVRMLYHGMWSGRRSYNSGGSKGKGGGASFVVMLLVALVFFAIGYVFTLLTRFAISRKREYMADAGGAELCGDPLALASALRKISSDPGLGEVDREDIAQLYIMRPKSFASAFTNTISSLFSTHPSIESRIAYLEQF